MGIRDCQLTDFVSGPGLYETRCTLAFSSPERFKNTQKRRKYAEEIPVSTVFADARNNVILCFAVNTIKHMSWQTCDCLTNIIMQFKPFLKGYTYSANDTLRHVIMYIQVKSISASQLFSTIDTIICSCFHAHMKSTRLIALIGPKQSNHIQFNDACS